ncbi:MAG: hypothetical protein ABII79_11450 [bacterium]
MRVLILGCCLILATISLNAATIHVPADQPTLQAGIDACGAGDTVLVAPGTYTENVDFGGQFMLTREKEHNAR